MNNYVKGKLIALGIIVLILLLSGCGSPTPEIILVDRETGEIIEPPSSGRQEKAPPLSSSCEDSAYWNAMGSIYNDMADAIEKTEGDISDAAIQSIAAAHAVGLLRMQALSPPSCAVRLHNLQTKQVEYYLEAYLAMLDYDLEGFDYWWDKGDALDPAIDAEYDKIEALSSFNSASNVNY